MTAQLKESYGTHPSAEIEIIDEGTHARVRVREPNNKASIFLTREDLVWLARQVLLLEDTLKQRGVS